MNFNIFTMVYGSHYVNLFREGCFRSLNWSKNLEHLRGKEWHVFTKREHFEEFEEIFKPAPFKLALIELGEAIPIAGIGYVKTANCEPAWIMLHGLLTEMKICLEQKKRMLFAPPDTLFGDGSVLGFLKAGQAPGSCVFSAHPRVLPTILERVKYHAATTGSLSNPQLVTLAMDHAHDSWKFAQVGHPKNNSFVGGIVWDHVNSEHESQTLIQVQHRLPTPYLVDFTADDWSFWWGQSGFGAYDHRWPGDNLIRQERMRYIGSSDAAFVVEITDHDKNVPQEIPQSVRDQQAKDGYFNWRLHNSVNRQFISYFRGE